MAFWNARDLPLNTRGIAWNRSPGISIAKSFETKSGALFLVYVATCIFFYGLGFDAFTEVVYGLSPNLGSWKGNSILDHPLLLAEDILSLHIHKNDDVRSRLWSWQLQLGAVCTHCGLSLGRALHARSSLSWCVLRGLGTENPPCLELATAYVQPTQARGHKQRESPVIPDVVDKSGLTFRTRHVLPRFLQRLSDLITDCDSSSS